MRASSLEVVKTCHWYPATLELRAPSVYEGIIYEEFDSMPQVKVRQDEPFDVILRRFRRACEKAGVFSEMRRREHYEKPTTVRKRKAAAARKRELKRSYRERVRYHRAY